MLTRIRSPRLTPVRPELPPERDALCLAGESALREGSRADLRSVLTELAEYWRSQGERELAREVSQYALDTFTAREA